MRVSVVVPTFNEADHLPGLLEALAAQTQRPHEGIVADASSTDGTPEMARRAGCRVVRGGLPAAGRNAGAAVAEGELLLFLDADVRPAPDFLELARAEFSLCGCVVATCPIEPLEPGALNALLAHIANLYLEIMRPISPHAPGSCILCLRSVHEAIGGFDESLRLAEDHDYVRRAAEHGRFCVLGSVAIPTSLRRVETEGLVSLALKYLYAELHALAGVPMRELPFDYEFGVHGQRAEENRSRVLEGMARLRRELPELGNPLERLSGRARALLDDLAVLTDPATIMARIEERLEAADIDVLDRYLLGRLRGLHDRPRADDEG
jgi:glycosyltransferase involved in cell wall biosynthesis